MTFKSHKLMKKFLSVMFGAAVALTALAGTNRDVSVPYNMYVEPSTHSCVVTWEDDENSAWNLRYRLFTEETEDPVMLHSVTASSYTGSYDDITLPSPWGGTNVRAGRQEIYFRNNYNNNGSYGNITYTIPAGYTDATFIMTITTYSSNSNGAGNLTVATPQTEAETHNFAAGDSYSWEVTASSGEKITITTPDNQFSPSISLMAVYYVPTIEWTYANNLTKMEYTIEDLELATDYEVQVQAIGDNGTLSDWCRPDVFTTLEEEPFVPVVHILGDIDDQFWSPFDGTKMEYHPETETYTATIHVEDGRSFGFTTEIDDNQDMGGWNYIEPYRFGPESDTLVLLTDEFLGRPLTLSFENRADIQAISIGDYEVTVSLELKYVIIEKVGEPEHGYQKGDVNHDVIVGIADVTTIIDYLLDKTTPICQICGDINDDGQVDIADATGIIDLILFGN